VSVEAFKSYCGDERSNPIAIKGPCRRVIDQGIRGVVRRVRESDNRMGLGAIFPDGILVATLGKIRVGEVFRG